MICIVVEPRKKVKAAVAQEQGRNATVISSLLKTSPSANTRVVQGVTIEDVIVGTGQQAKSGNRIKVNYVGKFKTNGRIFDSSTKKPFAFRLGGGEVIRGWDIGCDGMKVGGKRLLTIPPEKAYGRAGAPPTIPPNSTLVFEVTLIDIVK
ncbi:FKBP-type peptidyl-prolyl cis-trans isomerase [archaeon]|nr:MAG: FKBP-type peptidyl-prolyl cis-trans isomerase [archaeon]